MKTHRLGLTVSNAVVLLDTMSTKYLDGKAVIFDMDMDIGEGAMSHNIKTGEYTIAIGIGVKDGRLADQDFTRMAVVMMHEITHYKRDVSSNTDKDMLMSSMSTYKNHKYYKDNWKDLPHEIDAEYNGVMAAWSELEILYPKHADKLMFDYLKYRATKTNYMIGIPGKGFDSKEQADHMFNDAHAAALMKERKLTAGTLRSDDEVAQMLSNDDGSPRYEYAVFRNKLITAKGSQFDMLLTSLVAYIHPELEPQFPQIDFSQLDPEKLFGRQVPETREEILSRMHEPEQDVLFADSVADIPCDDADFGVAVDSLGSSASFQEYGR